MAITESLFGLTPEAIRAQQAANLERQALAFAQLSPMQAAQAGLFRAGNQLGGGIASLMGYKDPEIVRAEQRQGLLSGLDMNDPGSLMQAAQTAQRSGEFALAQALQAQASEINKQLETRQATAATAATEQRAAEGRRAFVKRRFPELSDVEVEALASDKTAVNKLLETPSLKTEIVNANGRQVLVNKETGARIADLGAAPETGTRVKVEVAPVIKQAGAVTGLVKDFEDLTQQQRKTLRDAQTAKNLINEAAKANNSQSWEAARTVLARAAGEGKLSNEDIRRTGVDPRLVQGALDWINRKVEGVPNQDIMRQLYTTASLLERLSTQRINESTERVRTIGAAEGIPDQQLNILFPAVGNQSGVVDWNSLKQ